MEIIIDITNFPKNEKILLSDSLKVEGFKGKFKEDKGKNIIELTSVKKDIPFENFERILNYYNIDYKDITLTSDNDDSIEISSNTGTINFAQGNSKIESNVNNY